MPNRTTGVLLVLFFGGLLAIWWADHARIPTEHERNLTNGLVLPQLIDTQPADVRRVEIAGGPRPLVFERREGGRWRMVEPVDALADGGRVVALIEGLKGLRLSLDAGTVRVSSGEHGFDHARTVRLFLVDGKTPLATLEIGDLFEGHDLRYVRAAGANGAELTDALKLSAVDLDASDWRERSLFTLTPFESARLSVVGPGRELEAARVAPGKWRLRRPVEAPADFNKLQGVLADLGALRVEDQEDGFVADNVKESDLARFGLDAPRMTVTLGGSEPKAPSQTIQIGKDLPGKADRAYARGADQDDVVAINPKALQDLGREPNALRSQKLADIDPSRVDFLSVRADGLDHNLARVAGGWVEVRRVGNDRGKGKGKGKGKIKVLGKVDPQVVHALLTKLEALETSQFLDPKAVPEDRSGLLEPRFALKAWLSSSDEPEARIEPVLPAGEPAADLVLGRQDAAKKVVYARTAGDAAVLLVPDNVLEALPLGPLAFRERTILAQDRAGFTRFGVRRGDRETLVQAPARISGGNPFLGWRLTKPVEAAADVESVARLAILLSGLRAEELVADSDPDPNAFGLDDPALSVSWIMKGALGTRRSLALGKEVPGRKGSRYAAVSGNPLVFTIAPQAVEILGAELHDRRLLDFPAEKVTRVILRWPGRSLDLVRGVAASPTAPTTWEPGPGADLSGFDVARVNPLLANLSHLTAARFARYDGPFPVDSGLSPAALTIRVLLEGDPKPRELRLGAPAPGDLLQATPSAGDSGPIALVPTAGWEGWITAPRRADDLPVDVFQGPRE